MTAELCNSVAQIARHAWRGTHWTKTPQGPRHVKEPLKYQHLEHHVSGGPGVGVAPITPGESTTRIALLDFDDHKKRMSWEVMVKAAKPVLDALAEAGYSPIPFRSSGGHGIHIYLLWEKPQDAYSVREMLRQTLESCGLRSGTKGVECGEAEVFPKQNEVLEGEFGSMFVLPLTGESLPLDPVTLSIESYESAEAATWPESPAVPVLEHPAPTPRTVTETPPELAEVKRALAAIPNELSNDEPGGLGYDAWRDIIFGIHDATGGSPEGLTLAHEFSARSPEYNPQFLDERVWPYIRSDRQGDKITAATIFARAREHGYVEDVSGQFEALPPTDSELPAANEPPSSPVSAGNAEASSAVGSRFQFEPVAQFADRPPPEWIVKGVIPRAELVVIYGESGSGKSFFALDLVGAICQGKAWRGQKVKQGRVAYVAAEAAAGFRNRVVAQEQHAGPVPDLFVLAEAPNLLLKDDVRDVIASLHALGKVDVVVIDTLAQTTPGGNENSGEDMGKALAHCRALHRATGAVVVLIHHAGKDLTKGARGWSGIRAAADAEIEISRNAGERVATITKQKDGSDGAEFAFTLRVVSIGEDAEGEEVTSCVLDHLNERLRPKREPRKGDKRTVLQVICDLADVDVEGRARIAAVYEEAKRRLAAPAPGTKDRRNENIKRALNGLAAERYIAFEGDDVRPL